jgi:hypothetical protein
MWLIKNQIGLTGELILDQGNISGVFSQFLLWSKKSIFWQNFQIAVQTRC